MDALETTFFAGLTWHFGAGKPYISGTAGIGVSRTIGPVQPGANTAVNFYNGGLGTRQDSTKWYFDTVLTAKVTAGAGQGNPMDIYPLHLDSGTGMEDQYHYSATLGTSLIFNNSNRNQQVGFLQLRVDDFSFQIYNDFEVFKKIGISDGCDRWWTGGGNITIGAKNSSYQLIIANDVFTADTDANNEIDMLAAQNNLEDFKASNTGSWFNRTFNRLFDYTPTTAREVDTDFLKKNRDNVPWTVDQHSFNLNQGQTSFRLRTPEGNVGVNGLGGGHMFSQNILHRTINFHLIPSERANYWEVQYGPATINKGF